MKADERLLDASAEALDGRPRELIEFARDALVLLQEVRSMRQGDSVSQYAARVAAWRGKVYRWLDGAE